MWPTIIAVVSATIAAGSLFLAWRHAREATLRREDVLKWSNQAISSLQGLALNCTLNSKLISAKSRKENFTKIAVETSILIEQGRLFFKNEVVDDWGKEKQHAYRGYRPKILDPLVIAHQIACTWSTRPKSDQPALRKLAEFCVREFVSLAQLEVGRSRAASIEAIKGGSGFNLDTELRKFR